MLVVCLVLLAAAAAAAAASLWLPRSELWAAGNTRAARQARYSAEAGIAHALAVIAPGAGFGSLLAGSGGLADPSRPGPLPLLGGGWVEFPGPPFGYAVTAAEEPPAMDGSPRIRLESTATAVRAARRRVRAVVGRALEPYVPAVLMVASGRIGFSGLAVGTAASPGVVLDARAGEPGRVAALASTTFEGLAEVLRASDAAFVARQGVPTHAVARPLDVGAFAAEVGLTPRAASEAVARLEGAGVTVARVERAELPRLVGRAAFVVDGDLTVVGEAGFEGVLLVGGRLRLEGAPCRLAGMVWAGEVELAAPCRFAFDRAAIAAADAALRLPRLPVLLALADVELP